MEHVKFWKALRKSRMLPSVFLQAAVLLIMAIFWGRGMFLYLLHIDALSHPMGRAVFWGMAVFVVSFILLMEIVKRLLRVEQTISIRPAERKVFILVAHSLLILYMGQMVCVLLVMAFFELKWFDDGFLLMYYVLFMAIIPMQAFFGLFSSEIIASVLTKDIIQTKPVIAKARS